MEPQVFLIQLVLILVSARVVGEVAAWFQIPSVIGELVAGILIGPSLLGLVHLSDPIQLLAQIGIILLLFEVGIENRRRTTHCLRAESSYRCCRRGVIPFYLWICN